MKKFDINQFNERLQFVNQFDGNLVFGAKKFHETTNRTGSGRPSSENVLVPEHAQVVVDTGVDRYQRKPDLWEDVNLCPVCKSPKRHFFLSRMALDIYRCEECSHRYLHPRIKFEKAIQIYGNDKTAADIYTTKTQINLDEVKYQYGFDLISQLKPPAQEKVLDIGCGAGTFLKVAYKNNWKYCVGVDPNDNYKGSYQNIEGVQFINGNFEALEPEKIGDNYDCISMWSVLEHLYDINSILATLKKMLKPKGLLFILVPNVESMATKLMRSMSPTFNWKHVSHFSPQSLKALMQKHQFNCVFFETVITEIDNIKSYLSGEYPYYGYGDPKGTFDFITPEFIHKNHLGSRMIGIFRND